jgi:ABC-type glutathione transport system ATPase component
MALILISHDLGMVSGRTDRVMVMYAGRAVEAGTPRRCSTRLRVWTGHASSGYWRSRASCPIPGNHRRDAGSGRDAQRRYGAASRSRRKRCSTPRRQHISTHA